MGEEWMKIEQLTIIFDDKEVGEHLTLQTVLRRQGLKKCKACKAVLPLHRFNKNKKYSYRARCKPCHGRHKAERKYGKPWTKAETVQKIVERTKYRAKKLGLAHSMTKEAVGNRLEECRWKCEFTRIKFELPIHKSEIKRARKSLSVHRVDPEKGYVMGNVKFILNQLNSAIGNGTAEEFEEMARAYIENKKSCGM